MFDGLRCVCRLPNKYDGKLEAPALFHHASVDAVPDGSGVSSGSAGGSDYYLWASHCTYWFPNDAYLLRAPASAESLEEAAATGGLWSPEGNPTKNDSEYTRNLPLLVSYRRF